MKQEKQNPFIKYNGIKDAKVHIHKTSGLYDASNEHDACGVGMIVDIHGNKSHELVDSALKVLENMKHRGAEGADNKTGDGAGIMLQIPHEFILLQGIPVPEKGKYGTGLVFLPKDEQEQSHMLSVMIEEIEREGLNLMHLRNVPVNSSILGKDASATEPSIKQIFITGSTDTENLERTLYIIRKRIENRIHHKDFYIVSLSSKNIVYKGMLSSMQVREYFPDLTQPYFTSGLAVVHSRFSTNTFPTWSLAQPFRLLAHNGEINTIRGNRAWMEARESVLSTPTLGNVKQIRPIIQPGMSDSASLDNVLEFFVMSGLSLPHAMAMLVPESFNDKNPISEDLKAFYEYHSILMEPWDGPATLLFSDGRYAGGMLDRNGLRPARYLITRNDMMVVASEAGTIHFEPGDIKEKGRLQPGKILLVDTQEGKIYYDGELKAQLAAAKPYRQWLSTNRIELDTLRSGRKVENIVEDYDRRLRTFGYTREDIERTLVPMATGGAEPTASMGNDTPLAVLSDKPQLLFNYFRQQFAQVTNPPIDPIREELVMSLSEYIGAVGMNILLPSEAHCKMVRLPHPVLTNTQLDILCNIRYKGFHTVKLLILFDVHGGKAALQEALSALCKQAEASVDEGVNYIILSDRGVDAAHAAIPSLLAVSAVHHHLISVQKRVQTALIIESGEIREVMHAALLLGYGASAINPYMAFAVLDNLVKRNEIQMNYETAEKNYIKAICKGLYKVMSKMGISTIRSYRGAKIFEAVGLSEELLKTYFGTPVSTIGGIRLEEIAKDYTAFHDAGFRPAEPGHLLPHIGLFSFRKDGEQHAWTPETISSLQIATRLGSYKKFKEFTRMADGKSRPIFLRDFFGFKRNPIDIDKVEPVEDIVKHFVTGAMSFGAISKEAHEALALAMNELGARSNTGEGGEDSSRFHETYEGIPLCSKTKQVASGRFGVTTEYLVHAEEIQIKVAQGAKPGEGGQLPGFKVDEVIAKTRHSIPGISLISPPPHHDIYSIEDLAELIYDLKNANRHANINVKLVSEAGVGTIAAGVAKGGAQVILVSGYDGGTGAAPRTSIKNAGLPWELGIAETHQTLILNGLRSRVRIESDSKLLSGRDVAISCMLGAEEFGFGTSLLMTMGCVMMRVCNLDTCPMGICTQNPELRKHFRGKPEYIINYLTFVAQELREYMAKLGIRTIDELVGRTDLLHVKSAPASSRMSKMDLDCILHNPAIVNSNIHFQKEDTYDFHLEDTLDMKVLMKKFKLSSKNPQSVKLDVSNTDRAFCAIFGSEITRKYGSDLPDDVYTVHCTGAGGQSFGAFIPKGLTLELTGDCNDYMGKGLSGGKLVVRPPEGITFKPEENIIIGNVALYGATSGKAFVSGVAGERFCVRNSGATAVVEGVGDHGCEYMTGGTVVVLGQTGKNFAAGMTGGVAYVLDENWDFYQRVNKETVSLEPVEHKYDVAALKELIREHVEATGSPRGKEILDNFSEFLPKFKKVLPYDYDRMLRVIASVEERGLDGEQAQIEAFYTVQKNK